MGIAFRAIFEHESGFRGAKWNAEIGMLCRHMSNRYRLGELENDQLLAAVVELVRRENDSLSDLLAHLAELDQRGLCLELGYSSLFAYCREALGFSKSSAGRRIAAARICRKYPEAFRRVASGELELSVLCALGQYLNADNARELFELCSRKSYEQVEELLAARFPKPDVRDLIRRLPERVAATPDIETAARAAAARAEPSAERLAKAHSVIESRQREEPPSTGRGAIKPLSGERFSVNFTADAEFRALLEEVRALASHSEPKGELLNLMKRALEAWREQLLKTRFGVGRKPRRVGLGACGSRTVQRNRHVPARVAREVYLRDGGQCTFCAEDGRRCSERRLLQLDHVALYSEGGEATVANLRLRCRAHNLHTARVHLGNERAQAAVRVCDARRAGGQVVPRCGDGPASSGYPNRSPAHIVDGGPEA
jgi:hypothetical protein